MKAPRKIDSRKDMLDILIRKVKKEREKVRAARRSTNPFWRKNFSDVQLESSPVKESSHLSQAVFNSLISRFDVKDLKDSDKLRFCEGKTTVKDVALFYYPPKKPA
jgi:hypothetical protein